MVRPTPLYTSPEPSTEASVWDGIRWKWSIKLDATPLMWPQRNY